MLGPNNIKRITKENMEDFIYKIDESIKKFHEWYPWESAVIEGEPSIETRNQIAIKYIEAGWNYVYHNTTSENGERAGLTGFDFSLTPLEKPNKNAFLVMRSAMNSNEFVVYKNDSLITTITV